MCLYDGTYWYIYSYARDIIQLFTVIPGVRVSIDESTAVLICSLYQAKHVVVKPKIVKQIAKSTIVFVKSQRPTVGLRALRTETSGGSKGRHYLPVLLILRVLVLLLLLLLYSLLFHNKLSGCLSPY